MERPCRQLDTLTFFSSGSNTCCRPLNAGRLAGPSSTRHWNIGWTVVHSTLVHWLDRRQLDTGTLAAPLWSVHVVNSTLLHSSRQSQTLVVVHSTLVHWLDRRPLDTGTFAGPLSTRHWYIGWTVVERPRCQLDTVTFFSSESNTCCRRLDTGTLAGPL